VQQIEMLSAQDGLTGVARRRHFDEMLRVECSRAARSRQALSVAIIAVDWFPEFNARYGHESGDACLCQLARVLETGVMRSGDLIARYSGSSFVLLAPDTDAHGILSIANYLCQEVLRLALPHHDSPYGCVSISIGVATANTHALGPDPHDPQGLLLQAQSCLASAQVQGRNQVSAF
jgi:diguanylate cyclase (GGDEF)-like protein